MSQFYIASRPTKVEIPNFVAFVVLPVLPAFFEAVKLNSFGFRRMEFSPGHEEEQQDPPMGQVTFEPAWSGDIGITFTVKYRAGEEGTRGSLSQIEEIEYRRYKETFHFLYLVHHCPCRQCPGMRYPFLPSAVATRAIFEQMSPDERLATIHRYIGKF